MLLYGGISCNWKGSMMKKRIKTWKVMVAKLKRKFILVDYALNLLRRL
jgi:hypothetical protein